MCGFCWGQKRLWKLGEHSFILDISGLGIWILNGPSYPSGPSVTRISLSKVHLYTLPSLWGFPLHIPLHTHTHIEFCRQRKGWIHIMCQTGTDECSGTKMVIASSRRISEAAGGHLEGKVILPSWRKPCEKAMWAAMWLLTSPPAVLLVKTREAPFWALLHSEGDRI